uniref:Uncharacterized protein n=1 Tax=Avena sativa TaxID=4498 RepID=A0ACD5ZGA1_AVESA
MDGALHEETRRSQQDRRELDAISEKTEEEDGRSDDLELQQVAGSERAMGEFDVSMSESCSGREEPAPEEGSVAADAVGCSDQGASFLRLQLSELEEATDSFAESARIGGGRGGVYRGTLRGMSVAVKTVPPDVAVNKARFASVAAAMARARHPGLVTPVGACPEAGAVVEELVPGGSLEDRLDGEASPLPWHARCGVAYSTCSALAYLHSTATVHGDVRAANILFEDERCASSKLAGLGASRLAAPKKAGRVALAYVDPRYLANGELTPQCDVHALGVLLLRLVTGKPAFGAKRAAREVATGRGRAWSEVSDASAGGWPTERAKEVAILGLKCCAVSDGRVPPHPADELLEEARSVLEAVTSGAPGRTRPRHVADGQPEASHDEPAPNHTSTPSAPPSSSVASHPAA